MKENKWIIIYQPGVPGLIVLPLGHPAKQKLKEAKEARPSRDVFPTTVGKRKNG